MIRSSFCSISLSAGLSSERFLERHVERRRDRLRDAIGVGVWDVHHPGDVADDRARLHRPERDDLRDVLAPVLVGDVLDHLAAAALAEVDVDVWQRHAFRVQEALEDEVVLDRIDVRDPEAVRDQAARGRPAPRSHRDPVFAGVADEVPRDHEVPGVLHLLDHVDFVVQPALVLVDRVLEHPPRGEVLQPRESRREAVPHDMLEVLIEGEAGRHVEVGQLVLGTGQIDVAPLGDADRILQRFREVPEDLRHLLGRLQVELVAVVAQPLGVVDRLAGADAQQNVVRLEVRVRQVVDVVGHDERQAEILRDRLKADVDDPLIVDALVLHLQKEVVGAEDVPIRRRRIDRPLLLLRADPGGDLTLEAAAQANEAGRMLREQLLVDARLVVEAFRVPRGHELDQVVVPLLVLGQEHQVVRRLAGRAALGAAIARGDVHLAPQDRIEPALARLVVEDDGREHVAMLGDRRGRHPELDTLVQQLLDAAGAVEQGIFGVQMQVDEVHCRLQTADCRVTDCRVLVADWGNGAERADAGSVGAEAHGETPPPISSKAARTTPQSPIINPPIQSAICNLQSAIGLIPIQSSRVAWS